MTADRSARIVINVLMNLVFVLAVVLVARVVAEFFGALASRDAARALLTLTDPLTLPLGLVAPRTPYGGVFDTDAAVTVVVLLGIEWGLSVVRWRG